ncbi:MAG: regulatory protein RecX [Pyrinomonadaceae bacterium]
MRKRRPAKARDINEDVAAAKRPARLLDPDKARARTLQRAGKLLAAKPRSVAELRERLLEKAWTNEEVVDAALAKLEEYGYVNDQSFALGFASYRVRQKPVGRQRLARDLQLKQISRETADKALDKVYEETPEEDLITRAIEKRARLRGLPQTRQETKSLYDYLLRLGFPYDLIIRKVREASAAEINEDETQADENEALIDETDADAG